MLNRGDTSFELMIVCPQVQQAVQAHHTAESEESTLDDERGRGEGVRAADVLEFLNQAVEHLGCSDSDTKLVQVWFARGKD